MKKLLALVILSMLVGCDSKKSSADSASGTDDVQILTEENSQAAQPQAPAVDLTDSRILVHISSVQAHYANVDEVGVTTQDAFGSFITRYQALALYEKAYAIPSFALSDDQTVSIKKENSRFDELADLKFDDPSKEISFEFSIYGNDSLFDDDIIENQKAVMTVGEILEGFKSGALSFEKSFSFDGQRKKGQVTPNPVVITLEFTRLSNEEYSKLPQPNRVGGSTQQNHQSPTVIK